MIETDSKNRHPSAIREEERRRIVADLVVQRVAEHNAKEVAVLIVFENPPHPLGKYSIWTLRESRFCELKVHLPVEFARGGRQYVKNDGDFGFHVSHSNSRFVLEELLIKEFPSTRRLSIELTTESGSESVVDVSIAEKDREFQVVPLEDTH